MQTPTNPVSQGLIYSDGSIYQYIGHLIKLGKMPYVDAFDHKGPVLYLINYITTLISERWGIWLIDFLFMCPVLILSYLTAKRFVSSVWALILCLIIYADFWRGYTMGDMPDYYAVLFDALGIYCLTDYYKSGDIGKRRILIVGVCIALGFWSKQTTVASLVFLCAPILWEVLRDRQYKKLQAYCLWSFSGFLIPSVLICLWLYLRGALQAMFTDYFLFSFVYSNQFSSGLQKAQSALWFLRFSHIAVLLVLYALYVCNLLRGEAGILSAPVNKRIISHGTFAVILTWLVIVLPGRTYDHYNCMIYPLIVLIAAAICSDFTSADFPNLKLYKFISVLLLGYLILYPNVIKTINYALAQWAPNPENQQVVAAIQSNCVPGDKIAVATPDNCGFYLASGFESATDQPYIQVSYYDDPEFCTDYRKQLDENRAQVIIWQNIRDLNKFFPGKETLCNYNKILETKQFSVFKRIDDYTLSWTKPLRRIQSAEQYLSMLARLADNENISVILSVKEQTGAYMNADIASNLKQLGFSSAETLLDQKSHSFIGVRTNAEVYEHITDSADSFSAGINGTPIEIQSSTAAGSTNSIIVNGNEYSLNQRGLNIVVLSEAQMVVDAVSFDTTVPEMTCRR